MAYAQLVWLLVICITFQTSTAGDTRTYWEILLGPHLNNTSELHSDVHREFYSEQLPRQAVANCLNTVDSLATIQKKAKNAKRSPVLHIIMSINENRLNQSDVPYVLDNWQAYAALHDYQFHLNVLEDQDFPQYLLFSKRWKSILHRFWSESDWVLHVDVDTAVVNLTKPITQHMHADKTFVLHVRWNNEITAATVMFQMNKFSHCFLSLWSALGKFTSRNWDNGDLNQLMLEFAHPTLAMSCDRNRPYAEFLHCFRLMLPHWQQQAGSTLPFRFFFPLEGFWRSHENPHRQVPFTDPAPYHFRCWRNDLIAHGWKQVGEGMWGGRSKELVDAGLSKCSFLKPEEELHWAKKCCVWHHPACVTRTGTNVCMMQLHCMKRMGAWGLPTGCNLAS